MNYRKTATILLTFIASISCGKLHAGGVVGGVILDETILNVPSEYSTIQDALEWLDTRRISRNVSVTIQIADGYYSDYQTVNLNHPQGDRIQILGNTGTPGNVVLQFGVGSDGFKLSGAGAFGRIDGLTIEGNYPTDSKDGVKISAASFMTVGPNISISGFANGISLYHSSGCNAYDIILSGNRTGARVTRTSHLELSGAVVTGNSGEALAADGNAAIHTAGASISGTVTQTNGGRVY